MTDARRDHLPCTSCAENPGRFGLHEKSANAPVVRSDAWLFELRPDHRDVRNAARGNPHLLAVQNVVVAIFAGARSHAPGVGAEVGLRQTEAAQFFSRGHLRQPKVLLLVGTKGINRIHHKRGLYADEAADAGISSFELLHQQSIFNVVHAGAAVAFERRPEEAEFAHGPHQLARKPPVAVTLLDDGDEVVLDKGARAGADDKFVI